MVERVHFPLGLTAAFFKESMIRDAIIGIKVVFALQERKSI